MIEYQIIPIILGYILMGLAWSDFVHSMIIKSNRMDEWTYNKKKIITIIWPFSLIVFVLAFLIELVKTK